MAYIYIVIDIIEYVLCTCCFIYSVQNPLWYHHRENNDLPRWSCLLEHSKCQGLRQFNACNMHPGCRCCTHVLNYFTSTNNEGLSSLHCISLPSHSLGDCTSVILLCLCEFSNEMGLVLRRVKCLNGRSHRLLGQLLAICGPGRNQMKSRWL